MNVESAARALGARLETLAAVAERAAQGSLAKARIAIAWRRLARTVAARAPRWIEHEADITSAGGGINAAAIGAWRAMTTDGLAKLRTLETPNTSWEVEPARCALAQAVRTALATGAFVDASGPNSEAALATLDAEHECAALAQAALAAHTVEDVDQALETLERMRRPPENGRQSQSLHGHRPPTPGARFARGLKRLRGAHAAWRRLNPPSGYPWSGSDPCDGCDPWIREAINGAGTGPQVPASVLARPHAQWVKQLAGAAARHAGMKTDLRRGDARVMAHLAHDGWPGRAEPPPLAVLWSAAITQTTLSKLEWGAAAVLESEGAKFTDEAACIEAVRARARSLPEEAATAIERIALNIVASSSEHAPAPVVRARIEIALEARRGAKRCSLHPEPAPNTTKIGWGEPLRWRAGTTELDAVLCAAHSLENAHQRCEERKPELQLRSLGLVPVAWNATQAMAPQGNIGSHGADQRASIEMACPVLRKALTA